MTRRSDVERALDRYLGEGATALPDWVLDDALDQIEITPQRRAWRVPGRFPEMPTFLKPALVGAAIVAVLIVGGAIVAGGPTTNLGGPAAEPSLPSAAGSPRVLPMADGQFSAVSPGSYSLSEFPVGITFEIPAFEPPAERFACGSAVEPRVCVNSAEDIPRARAGEDIPPGAAVTFQIVDTWWPIHAPTRSPRSSSTRPWAPRSTTS